MEERKKRGEKVHEDDYKDEDEMDAKYKKKETV